MNKKELITRVQQRMGVGCTRESASGALAAVLESIVRLSHEDSVILSGFGRFSQKTREQRLGHHPQTKAPLIIPAQQSLSFSPSPKLLGSTYNHT